jgi:hypothetical protein
MSVAVAHAVCAAIGLASLPRMMFADPMFKDALRPLPEKRTIRSAKPVVRLVPGK